MGAGAVQRLSGLIPHSNPNVGFAIALVAAATITLTAIALSGSALRNPGEMDISGIATHVAQGKGLTTSGGQRPTARRPPLYPAFVGAVYRVFGERPQAAKFAGGAVWAATILVVFLTARGIYDTRTARVAALLFAFYLPLVLFTTFVLTEVLAGFLFAACYYYLVRYERNSDATALVGAGRVLGLAALTRSAFLVVSPLIFIWVYSVGRKHPRLPRAILFLAVFAIVLAPWAIRNWRLFDQPVLIDTFGGVAVFLGNSVETPMFHSWEVDRVRALAPINVQAPENEAERQTMAYREALSFVAEHPGRFVLLLGSKAMDYWETERIFYGVFRTGGYEGMSRVVALAITGVLALSFAGTVLLAAVGLKLAGLSPAAKLSLLMAAGLTMTYVLSMSHSRYNMALIGVLVPFSAYGLLGLKDGLSGWRRWHDGGIPMAWWPVGVWVVFLSATWMRQIILDLPKLR